MLLIDKYAYLNKLAAVHPLEKMIFSLGLLLITLIMRDERLSLITFFVMSAFIILGAKIPLTYYGKLLLLPGFFLLTSLVSILLSFTSSTNTLLPIFGRLHGGIGLFLLGTQVCYQRNSCSLLSLAALVVYTF
ncbi:hypothetical protein [Lysinibacillus sp. FN11]|uniref:hypothetical protein n=1 Tax=Lysinibacillus sp. FN11 TaxID=2968499 RepID=UPI00214A98B5|nr:hypothetical protein [Lysinibacillus sp. FN11]UUV27428.1 hypothetical protein NP781_13140 [Lysinibacillus sp. FN11]